MPGPIGDPQRAINVVISTAQHSAAQHLLVPLAPRDTLLGLRRGRETGNVRRSLQPLFLSQSLSVSLSLSQSLSVSLDLRSTASRDSKLMLLGSAGRSLPVLEPGTRACQPGPFWQFATSSKARRLKSSKARRTSLHRCQPARLALLHQAVEAALTPSSGEWPRWEDGISQIGRIGQAHRCPPLDAQSSVKLGTDFGLPLRCTWGVEREPHEPDEPSALELVALFPPQLHPSSTPRPSPRLPSCCPNPSPGRDALTTPFPHQCYAAISPAPPLRL